MSYDAKTLALRDAAAAAALGAFDGSDMGHESSSGSSFGWDAPGGDFAGMAGDFSGGFFAGEGFFGADGPAPALAPVPQPTQAQALALWHQKHAEAQHTQRRTALLNPNAHSTVKVERYSLQIATDVVVGTANTFNITKSPDTELRAQRITSNIGAPGFVYIDDVKVANVSVTQGDSIDAWQLNPNSWGQQFDIPTLSPANRVTVIGHNTTAIPTGFSASDAYKVILMFLGPTSMTG